MSIISHWIEQVHGIKYKVETSTYQFKLLDYIGSPFVFKTHHASKGA